MAFLDQGVALVDDDLACATVNQPAARLLGLTCGEVTAAEFHAAMADLEQRAANRSDVASLSRQLAADATGDFDCTWRFAEAPTHIRVSSHAIRQAAFNGRVWVFDDISAWSEALEATEATRSLLRANADGMLNPQVLLESIRDPGGEVIDLVCRSANRAAHSYLGRRTEDLVDHSARKIFPGIEESGLITQYVQCLDDGQPVALNDVAFFNDDLGSLRRYNIRATRAGLNLVSVTWRDVTEDFKAEERIAASERSYRLLAENIGDVVCHIREGRFTLISGPVEAVLGAPAAHWIGRNAQEIIPPEDQVAYAARVQTLIGGGTLKERVRVTGADGVTKWVHMHAKPYHDLDGRQDGVAATFRAIDALEEAALREAEEARRQQAKADERYRRSMDNAAVGMCLLDPEGRFQEVNGALCQLFGYEAEALMQKTWRDLTAPEFLEIDQQNVNDLLDGRLDSYRMVKQYVSADGKRIWGDLAVSCIRDQEGRVENFISQITDITATVEADERNRILAERLQQQSDRLAAELSSAASYMSSVMPRGLTGKVNVSSRYLPSRELGGDCFDYVWVDDDHLLVYLIDVSGHGIEPALLSVSVHNMLRTRSFTPVTLRAPDAVLAELNQLFRMDQQGDHYFTMWFGVYEASTRLLRYASAGAPPALAFTSMDGNDLAAYELGTKAAPIGMFEDTVFTSNTYRVPHACRILVYSDGASEIILPGSRSLSMADFKEVSTRLMGSADWSVDQLVEGLRSLNPQGHFEDDCSLILLSFD